MLLKIDLDLDFKLKPSMVINCVTRNRKAIKGSSRLFKIVFVLE